MKKAELKKILRPLIKECVKEVIFEEGTLSTIISEVVKGTSTQTVFTESKSTAPPVNAERRRKELQEKKKRMLDAIGKDAFNGVNLFEGTSPAPPSKSSHSPQGSGALDGVSPNDPGVDISAFGTTGIWKKLAGN